MYLINILQFFYTKKKLKTFVVIFLLLASSMFVTQIVLNLTNHTLFFQFLTSLGKLATVSSIRIRRLSVFSQREQSAIDRCIIYCAASAHSIDDRVTSRVQLAYELERRKMIKRDKKNGE